MDMQRLLTVPGLPRSRRRTRRIQRQVHGESDGVTRVFAGDTRRARARELSQFLLSAGALAVQRAAARSVRLRGAHGFSCTQTDRGAEPRARRLRGRCARGSQRYTETSAGKIFL